MDNLSLYQWLAEYIYQDIKRFDISRENFKLHSYKPLSEFLDHHALKLVSAH